MFLLFFERCVRMTAPMKIILGSCKAVIPTVLNIQHKYCSDTGAGCVIADARTHTVTTLLDDFIARTYHIMSLPTSTSPITFTTLISMLKKLLSFSFSPVILQLPFSTFVYTYSTLHTFRNDTPVDSRQSFGWKTSRISKI